MRNSTTWQARELLGRELDADDHAVGAAASAARGARLGSHATEPARRRAGSPPPSRLRVDGRELAGNDKHRHRSRKPRRSLSDEIPVKPALQCVGHVLPAAYGRVPLTAKKRGQFRGPERNGGAGCGFRPHSCGLGVGVPYRERGSSLAELRHLHASSYGHLVLSVVAGPHSGSRHPQLPGMRVRRLQRRTFRTRTYEVVDSPTRGAGARLHILARDIHPPLYDRA
jgi:hypothetical protein